jgi:benzylsuccinate CoA-transferase BbsF subunit
LIDLSHQETSIHLIADQMMEFAMTGETPTRQGNRNRRMAPHGNFPCQGDDSWIAIAVRSNEEWRRLAAIIGDEVLADPRFTDLSGRLEHVEMLEGIVARWTSVRDADSITIQLQTEGIPCAPVLETREVAENPQLVARGFFETVDHPDTGAYPHPRTPWRLSGMPYHTRTPAPGIGQHSIEVLSNLLGLSIAEIDGLVKRGITGDTPDLDA